VAGQFEPPNVLLDNTVPSQIHLSAAAYLGIHRHETFFKKPLVVSLPLLVLLGHRPLLLLVLFPSGRSLWDWNYWGFLTSHNWNWCRCDIWIRRVFRDYHFIFRAKTDDHVRLARSRSPDATIGMES